MSPEGSYDLKALDRFIERRFRDLRREDRTVRVLEPPREPFLEWEAEWFLRGARDGRLFGIEVKPNDQGFASSCFTGGVTRHRDGRERNGHFLEVAGIRGSGRRKVGREGITNKAVVAQLVFKHGHDPERVRTQSERGEVDIVVYDRDPADPRARPILAGETKVTGRDLDRLITGMRVCRGEGGEGVHREACKAIGIGDPGDKAAANHHKKCLWVASNRPRVFWAVSRDFNIAMKVSRSPPRFRLVGNEFLMSG